MITSTSPPPQSLTQAWRELSPLLDELLQYDEPARSQWLTNLARSEPTLAARLRALLLEQEVLQREQFLTDTPGAVLDQKPLTGQTLGAYTLDSPLGQGGMGTVWLAHRADGRFEGLVAVKLLHASLARHPISQNFIAEGNVLAQLQHPNIAHLIDAGITPSGQPYLVLQYVEGVRIDRHCEQQQLTLQQRIKLFLDVLAAVAHAHTHLVIHCDIKPSNILVTNQGQVKLLDFGISTLLTAHDQPSIEEQVLTTSLALTPQYAAPEQMHGEPVTTATDVYALGLVLYLLVAGRHRIEQHTDAAGKLAQTRLDDSVPASSLLPSHVPESRILRDDLDAIYAKSVDTLPQQRYQSVDAFAEDLRRSLADQPIMARAPSFTYRAHKFWRRNRGGVLSATLTSLVLIISTAFALQQMMAAHRQRDVAQEQLQRAEDFNTVITNLLAQAGPGGGALSAEQLLDRAIEVMEHEYAYDPETLVSMLMRISGRYFDLLNTQKEYDTLLRAERIARAHDNPMLLLEVDCNTVETEVDLGRIAAAGLRLQEAQSLLKTVGKVDDGLRSDCLRNAAVLARAKGQPQQALSYARQGLKVLEQAGRTAGNRYSGLLSIVATFNDNQVEAHHSWLQLRDLHEYYGRTEGVAGISVRTGIANSLLNLVQVRAARDMLETIEPPLAQTPIGKPRTTVALLRYGQVMTRLGDYQRAREALTAALASNEGHRNRRFEIDVRIALADALIGSDNLDLAQQQLVDSRALLAALHTKNLRWRMALSRLATAIALEKRHLPEAQRELTAALARVITLKDKQNLYLGHLLLLKTRLAIAQGKSAVALHSADRALKLFTVNSLGSDANVNFGEALLLQAEAYAAAADRPAARKIALRAYSVLRDAVGDAHPLTIAARQLKQAES